ncbi:hypothetical protein Dimus_019190 [Dionaea muscipula]
MDSSDSEAEGFADLVSSYYFEDGDQEPVSFSVLPTDWNGDGNMDGGEKQIFLRGTTDDGLQKVYKPVTAWRFDLSGMEPDISVFSRDNRWLKLEKPRKNYRDIIRTTLISLHCLHILKKNPDLPEKSLWEQLSKIFRWYDAKPSQNDLIDHMVLIEEAVKRDELLRNSKFLVTLLKEKPQKKVVHEDALNNRSSGFIVDEEFIVDEDGVDNDDSEAGSDDEEEDFAVCEICDNGGDVLCCDGSCLRSFHPSETEGARESNCATLRLSKRQVDATPIFLCPNCKYKQHQCFSCGQLGCSDINSVAEVFRCINATCGRFYHPKCVGKLLHRDDAAAAVELERKIAAGEKFTCPVHKCNVCGKGEDPDDPELRFAVCRRCPKSYHKKCLPRRIAFEDNDEEGFKQRAWMGLLPNHRILIYCLKHEIDEELRTPIRNHIKFPDVGNNKIKHSVISSRDVLKDRQSLGQAVTGRTSFKSEAGIEKPSITKREEHPAKEMGRKSLRPISKVFKGADASKKQSTVNRSLALKQEKSPTTQTSKEPLGEQLYSILGPKSGLVKNIKPAKLVNEVDSIKKPQPASKSVSYSLPQLDQESENRILALMEEAMSSVTMDDIFDDHDKASTHSYSLKMFVEKTITQGKVEGSIEAIQTALKKLDEGYTIEDAKAVCEPDVLNQLVKWKNKLKVYLAPFLFGMRYTSFGRHFTKVDKLKEIVDKIHWYVNEGDTMVDFCCGANDFSFLMKEKLENTGKKCFYRNFDLFRPKNDFNFEKRDWMSVRRSELPQGSQLIMGLNPPFGVKASLANKFINKALEFKPKLVILIVPPELERLDQKKPPYDLVWEDNEKLSGRSFYLPGSVDVNDKQLDDWNVVTPLLYLWSRPDWTVKHKAIAEEHGHITPGKRIEVQRESNSPHEKHAADSPHEKHAANPAADVCDEDGDVAMEIDDNPPQNNVHNEPNEGNTKGTEVTKAEATTPAGNKKAKVHLENSRSKKQSKRRQSFEKHARAQESGRDQKRKRQSSNDPHHGRPRHSVADRLDVRTSDSFSRRNDMSAATGEIGDHGRSQPAFAGSASQYGVGYHEPSAFELTSIAPPPDYHVGDMSRRYSFELQDPYSNIGRRWGGSVGAGEPDYGPANYARETDSFNLRPYPSEVEPTYNYPTGMSAMQRYAPRLDELNRVRMGNGGSEYPGGTRIGMYDPPRPNLGGGGVPMGFAPGPHSYSHQSSSGWIHE